MSNNKWMNKQIVVYPYNAILFWNKTKLTTDSHNIMDESQKQWAIEIRLKTLYMIPFI